MGIRIHLKKENKSMLVNKFKECWKNTIYGKGSKVVTCPVFKI